MLQKLFRKHSLKQSQEKNFDALLEPTSWSPIPFESQQIRVLVCQDNGDKRKLPLLDTDLFCEESIAQPEPAASSTRNILSSSWSDSGFFSSRSRSKRSSLSDVSSSTGCTPSASPNKKLGYNLDIIGEMMFGAVPLSYKGMTTKIHHTKGEKQQILLTKLFPINMGDLEQLSGKPQRSMSITSECSDVSIESWNTLNNDHWGNKPAHKNSTTLSRVNENHSCQGSLSSSIFSADENFSGEDLTSIPNAKGYWDIPKQTLSSSTNSYKDRRLWRSSQTSIENGVFNPTPLPGKPILGTSSALKHSSRSIMYSIGVVISLEDNQSLKEYLFSHFSLLEARLHKLHGVVMSLLYPLLRRHVIRAQTNIQNSMYSHKNGSIMGSLPPYSLQSEDVLKEAVSKFIQDICDLYQTPRLQTPLWLNLHTFPHNRVAYYQSFVAELADLLDQFETPKSNHFISTLFTAVLTNHLSWVPTVAPPGLNDFRNPEANRIFDNAGLSYNPLWAQYSDLYGNAGSPPRLCRVIVVGTSATFVKRILYILSYLLRCNEVFENVEELAINDNDSQSDCSSVTRATPSSPLSEPSRIFPAILNTSSNMDYRDVLSNSNRKYQHVLSTPSGENQMKRCNYEIQNKPFDMNIPLPKKFDGNFEKAAKLTILNAKHKISQVTEQLLTDASPEEDGVLENDLSAVRDRMRTDTIEESKMHLELEGNGFSQTTDDGFIEIPMIESQMIAQIPSPEKEYQETRPDRLFAKSFGRSMMVGYCSKYMPDFVLMGLPRFDFLDELEDDLKDSVQYRVDGPISQSSCIIADTNTWQCNLVDYSSKPPLFDSGYEENFTPKRGVTIQRVLPADFIRQMLQQTQHLFRLGIPAESCTRYFEDMLQELYLKSRVIAEFLDSQEADRTFDHKILGSIVNLKESDMPLLISVAKTHSLSSFKTYSGL